MEDKQIKVAMIPDDTRIIINVGLEDYDYDYLKNQEIEIYVPGEEIIDPDTKEIIGVYNPVKEKLKITDVYDTYSVARKEVKRKSPMTAIASPMLNSHSILIESLDIEDSENLRLDDINKTIKIGDLVRFA